MSERTIKKSITIPVSVSIVWSILTEDDKIRQWAAAFAPGTYAVSDRKEGAQIEWRDHKEVFVKGVLTSFVPNKQITTNFYAGSEREGFTNELTTQIESYTLIDKGDYTILDIESGPAKPDEREKGSGKMSTMRDNALMIIKNLAEKLDTAEKF